MTFRGIRSLLLAAAIAAVIASPARAQGTTGTITADGGSVVFDNGVSSSFLPAGYVTLGIQSSGTWTGTLEIQGSVDCTTYRALDAAALSGSSTISSATANGTWRASIAGLTCVRVRANGAWTGTATVSFRGSAGGGGTGGGATLEGDITIENVVLGAGDNNIGNVDVASSALPTGASTSAAQTTGNASLGSIDGKITAVNTGAVVVASSALPSGASTAAKQPALGIAGSPSSDVITIQGHASGTPIPVGLGSGAATAANQVNELTALQIIDNLPNTLGSTTSGQSGVLALGAVTTASPSYTTAQTNALSLDTAGSLRVAIVSGGGSGGTALADGGTFTAGSTSATPMSGLYEASPTTCTTGKACAAGLTTNRELKVSADTELPSAAALADNTANPTIPAVASYNMCYDGSTWDRCPASAGGAGAVDANTNRTVTATDSPDVATLGATSDAAATAGSTGSVSAKLRTATQQLEDIKTAVQLIDNDQTGATPSGVVSAASTNSTNLVAAAGRLMGMYLTNNTTTIYYIRFYNSASAPTCSSATGYVFTMAVPPAAAAGGAGGFSMPFGPQGLAFGTGIGYCITGGPTSTDNTNAAVGIYGVIATK